MKVKICQIGSGKVAKIRRQNYPENAKVVALIVRNVLKYLELVKKDETLNKNVLVTNDLGEVLAKFSNNLIWDIVSDDKTHFDYFKTILEIDTSAKIILGKTPYQKDLILKFLDLAKRYPDAKISVTENYAVSQVTAKVKELAKKYEVSSLKIILEFTKNRIKDIEQGRFVHHGIGVLGYEGGHMITILANLGKNFTQVKTGNFANLKLTTGEILKNQGSAKISGTANNSEIIFYTSMDGKILNKLKEAGVTSDIEYGNETRYRLVILEDGEKQVIGQYDPVPGLNVRPFGRVIVRDGNKIVEKIDKIYDNTMRAVLEQQICYLTDSGCVNPMSLKAAKNFRILEKIYNEFKN